MGTGGGQRVPRPAQGGVDKVTDDPVLCEVGHGALCMSVSFLDLSGTSAQLRLRGAENVLPRPGTRGGPPVCAFL